MVYSALHTSIAITNSANIEPIDLLRFVAEGASWVDYTGTISYTMPERK